MPVKIASRVSANLFLAVLVLTAAVSAPERGILRDLEGKEMLPLVTGKGITPQGRQTNVGSFPANMLLSPDGRFLVVTNTGFRQAVSVLSVEDGRLVSQIEVNGPRADGSKLKQGLYYGLAFGSPADSGTPLYVSRGAEDRVSVFSLDAEGRLRDTGRSLDNPSGVAGFKSPHIIAGLALSSDGGRLYAVNNNTTALTDRKGSLSILDPAANRVTAKVSLPGYPYAVAALTRGPNRDRKVYVTSERDGGVVVVDPVAGRAVRGIPCGDQPIALLLDPAQERLFVANAGSDTVSVVNTRTDEIERTVLLRPEGLRGLPGVTPTGLALAPNGKRLYVTLADMNSVAVVETSSGKVTGYIPAGWYPTAVAVSPDGQRLFVANAKGVNARNPNGTPAGPGGKWGQYIQNLLEGTVSTLPVPDGDPLKRLSRQTIANNRLQELAEEPDFTNPGIEHVFYIIKENRTYDQVLGDLPKGNGDPKLCLFPREVTPNQHALVERFVLLDNFYCCAEVSADGWNWSTSGMANEYTSRNAPYGYSQRGRPYDYDGRNGEVAVDLLGLPDVARSSGGYLWDNLLRRGVPFRNYGFFTSLNISDAGVPIETPGVGNRPTKKALAGKTDENFRRFDLAYADSDAWVAHDAPAPNQLRSYGAFGARSRFEAWKREFDGYVRRRDLPPFQMIRLPRDHTAGTTPGLQSPRAMVADNDYAVGQVVEAISQSPYWKKSALFILEDDAQNGFDHVDAHRSIAFVISPLVRKGTVDHRFYNTDSMLLTIELLLGLPPMCQYDAIAAPLNIFREKAGNDDAYAAILPEKRIIAEFNRATAYRAGDSQRLNFREPDAVPDQELNDILWHALRGRDSPKPAIRYGLRLGSHPRDEDD